MGRSPRPRARPRARASSPVERAPGEIRLAPIRLDQDQAGCAGWPGNAQNAARAPRAPVLANDAHRPVSCTPARPGSQVFLQLGLVRANPSETERNASASSAAVTNAIELVSGRRRHVGHRCRRQRAIARSSSKGEARAAAGSRAFRPVRRDSGRVPAAARAEPGLRPGPSASSRPSVGRARRGDPADRRRGDRALHRSLQRRLRDSPAGVRALRAHRGNRRPACDLGRGGGRADAARAGNHSGARSRPCRSAPSIRERRPDRASSSSTRPTT